jgi:hypothetical protein
MSGESEEPAACVNPTEARRMPGTELAAARNTVHDMSFDEMLNELMAVRDMSVGQLARKVPCTAGHIANLTNAAEEPTRRIATRLDEVLKAGGRLLDLAESGGRGRTPVPAVPQHGTADLPRSLSLSLPYVPGRLVIEISGAARNENPIEDDRAAERRA